MNKFAVIAALAFCGHASAKSSVIGTVYPIAERDALVVIKQKAAQVDWQKAMQNHSNSWLEQQQTPLPAADKNQIRFHRPNHRLQREIVDAQGTVIYPQGFAFNPLAFIKVPFRIVVLSLAQLAWFKPNIKPTDRVLLTEGDVFKARDILGRTVFLLDGKTQVRLNVLKVPSIIRQKGHLFELEEFNVERSDRQ